MCFWGGGATFFFAWGRTLNFGIASCGGGRVRDFARSSPVRGVRARVGSEKREAMGAEEKPGAPQPWWDTVRGAGRV